MKPFQDTTRPAQRPTEEPYDFGGRSDVKRSHPAFGMIGVSRVSGSATLFGSAIEHAGYLLIRIQTAFEIDSGYSHKRPFADKVVAEVCVSEAQWARFVSTPNVGEGVPCTIRYMRSGDMVAPPEIENDSDHVRRADDIQARAKEMVAQFQAAVDELDKLAKAGKATKADLQRVRALFLHPVDYAGSNAKFFADSMTKHMEGVVADVKSEVDAYVTRVAMQFPALAGDLPKTPGLIEGKAREE